MLALVLVAGNLRAAISSVPEVIVDIRAELGWNDVALGALTTIPVLCMGIFALAVPAVSNRFGRSRTVAMALGVLVVALVMRLAGAVPGVLYLSALLAGLGIALAAGLVPGLVREQVPGAVGKATGIWSAVLMLGAGIGGALTVPIAIWTGSWKLALAFWSIPAAVALVGWIIIERPSGGHEPAPGATVRLRALPWRSPTAWALTMFLALNSVIFYSTVAWLAASYDERGWNQATGGGLFGLFTLSMVAAAFLLPPLADHLLFRRSLYAFVVLVGTAALLLIGLVPNFLPALVLIVGGIGLGGTFALGLVLLSEYSADAVAAARLTAMAFFVSYTLAALGPLLTGVILQLWDSWPLVYGFLAVASLGQLLAVLPLKRGLLIH
ncbi:MFS transporter [Actinomycetes bacterium]|nr:MFS transporter [Actinomycetes bacterium]